MQLQNRGWGVGRGLTAIQRSPRTGKWAEICWSEQWRGTRLVGSKLGGRSPALNPTPPVMRPPRPGLGPACPAPWNFLIKPPLTSYSANNRAQLFLSRCGVRAVLVFHGCFCVLICGGKETPFPAFFSQHLANFRVSGVFVCFCYRFFDVDSFKSLH